MTSSLSPDLAALEAEGIRIIREVAAAFRKPVMLYSIGKDSSVILHLALKAFYPAPLPFPLLHVDTTWKFSEMISFRNEIAVKNGLELLVHINADGVARGIGPLSHGGALHTQVMKTDALKQALEAQRFDAAIGGARRDEEKSRAKERVMSHRTAAHGWDPKNQRPEFWNLYNTQVAAGESMRVFPLSNWTEIDVWHYIEAQGIDVVPLYFAKMRPVVARGDMLIMADDDRLTLAPGEKIEQKMVRFRTLGCYPLTGAVASKAATIADVVTEVETLRISERSGRMIDHEDASSMEAKKREGYF